MIDIRYGDNIYYHYDPITGNVTVTESAFDPSVNIVQWNYIHPDLYLENLQNALKDTLALADSGVYKRIMQKYPDIISQLEKNNGTK